MFFADVFAPFLDKYKKIFASIAVLALSGGVYLALQLEGDTEAPDYFGPNHPFTHMFDILDTFVSSSTDPLTELLYVWGVEEIANTDGFSNFDFASEACNGGACGTHVVDETFSFSTEEDQLFLENFCDTVVASEWSRDDGSANNCFVKELRNYREMSNLSFPVPEGELADVLDVFFQYYFFYYIADKRIKWNSDTKTIEYMSVGFLIDFDPTGFYNWNAMDPVYVYLSIYLSIYIYNL